MLRCKGWSERRPLPFRFAVATLRTIEFCQIVEAAADSGTVPDQLRLSIRLIRVVYYRSLLYPACETRRNFLYLVQAIAQPPV